MTDHSLPSVGSVRPSRRTLLVCLVALMTVLAGCGGGTGDGGGDAGTTGTETGTSTGTPAADETTSADSGDTGDGSSGGGTGGDSTDGTTTQAATGSGNASMGAMSANASGGQNASIRVAHMSPDAPAVDVTVDGREVLTEVSFPEVSEYLSVPAGQHRVRITEAGSSSNVLYNETATFDARPYTLLASGEVTNGARSSTDFGVSLLADRTAPSSANASIRLAHVSPDAGPVDVTVNGSGRVLFDNISFSNASRYAEVPGGNYTLDIRRATGNNSGPTVESFDLEVSNGTAYTVFTAGYVTPSRAPVGVSLEPITATDGLEATIRFAHVAPDSSPVSVYVNGQLADRTLPYSATTEYFEVPAGNRTVTITAANASEPLYQEAIGLNASTNYTVVAAGETADNGRPFDPVVLNDDAGREKPTTSTANARFLHAAPDAPPVDVVAAERGVIFDGVAYGNASSYTMIPGGNYTFEAFVATADNTGDDVATFPAEELPGGASYTLFLAGYVTPGDEPASMDIELIVANDTEDYADRDSLD